MIAEIIPEGYDIAGKKIFRPHPKNIKKRRYRIFHPTFPMGRFVSKPLMIRCANLQEVQQFLLTCSYVSDMEQFQQADYWLPPDEFEHIRKGDCEDFALWTWRQVMDMGYTARFVVGRSGRYGNGHAWVTMEKDGKHLLVEPLLQAYGLTFPRLSILRYCPETSVEWDGRKLSYYRHNARSYSPPLHELFTLIPWVKEWVLFRWKVRRRRIVRWRYTIASFISPPKTANRKRRKIAGNRQPGSEHDV